MNRLYGRTHFELEEFINLENFDKIQIDIFKGIAQAKIEAPHGYTPSPLPFNISDLSFQFKSLMIVYQDYLKLSETDPIRVAGDELESKHGHTAFTTFLKYVYGAHDLTSHYSFWDYYPEWQTNPEKRTLSNIANHFPSLISYIDSLITDGIFSSIGRAYLIAVDSNGYSHEHRDPPADFNYASFPEFIHIRPNLKRPFYVYDPYSSQRHYINSRVGWWNDSDIHGGEVTMEPSYAIRIDGIFTNSFRDRIGIL